MRAVRDFYADLGVHLPARGGPNVQVRCFANPAAHRHDDRHPSCSINTEDGRWYCHACGEGGNAYQAVVRLRGIEGREVYGFLRQYGLADEAPRQRGGRHPSERRAYVHRSSSEGGADGSGGADLTVEAYARAKGLPPEFLRSLGVSDYMDNRFRHRVLRIPYIDAAGNVQKARLRKKLHKPADGPDDRFLWASGGKVLLYGLDRVDDARAKGYVVVVEGESDAQTLWYHGIPAVGLPGAGQWREERDAEHLAGIERIYVVIEPDTGGDAVLGWLGRASIRDRVWLVELDGHKDPPGLHLDDPERFAERWRAASDGAEPWRVRAAELETAERREAQVACAELAHEPRILDRLLTDAHDLGLVGEDKLVKLIFLAATSRLFRRPVSLAVKGPSSGGKSYTVEQALRFLPDSAYHTMTGMSERGLIYDEEPLAHRMLVIYEAAGFDGDVASYVVRSLLSEGRLRYLTTGKTDEGIKGRWIERDGPTGLITTTTAVHLHPENETRLISIAVDDTRAQTAAVMLGIAEDEEVEPDLGRWHALQRWIELGDCRVVVPYARELAKRIDPVAVRLRRDFSALLTLVQAHALLHQAQRRRDEQGRLVACHEDYAAVREVAADLISAGVQATVKRTVRETVKAVEELGDEPSQSQVARYLGLDQSACQRRVREAVAGGWLRNLEERRGRPARLVLGEGLPEDSELLPTPSEIADLCTYASDSEGIEHRPPTDAHEDGGQGEVDRNADPELAARADAIQERFDQAGWS